MKRIFSVLALCLLTATGYSQTNTTPLPKMHGDLAGVNKGDIKKEVFSAQIGVLAQLNQNEKMRDAWKGYRYKVTSFTVHVMRNNVELFTRSTQGANFDEETHNFFQTVKAGDIVSVKYITCNIWPINKTIPVDPIEVTIHD